MLGGSVSERDAVRRDEDADAASGPCAGGDALQGVEHADVVRRSRGDRPTETALQGASVQRFRFSEEGRATHEHGSPATGGGAAVFGVVNGLV